MTVFMELKEKYPFNYKNMIKDYIDGLKNHSSFEDIKRVAILSLIQIERENFEELLYPYHLKYGEKLHINNLNEKEKDEIISKFISELDKLGKEFCRDDI